MFRKKTKKGFTIVELVIVIAVIAILSAVLIPTFAGLIKKANISADQTLVRNLNTSLAISSEGGGTKNSTMYQTLEAMKEQGYSVEKLTPTHSKNNIVWDSENNQFVLVYENGETFTGTTVDPTVDKSKMWKIYTEIPTESEYSVYLAGTNVTGNVEVKGVGFDAGENVGISTVTYKNETNVAKDVVIRTNSYDTVLTINAPKDTVKHYDKANKINVEAVAMHSYHEFGDVLGNINLKSGNVVVEEDCKASAIVITSTEDDINNNSVVVKADNTKEPSIPIIVPTAVKTAIENKAAVDSSYNGGIVTSAPESIVTDSTVIENMSKFAGGIGTEESPYLIANQEQFESINNLSEKMKEGTSFHFKQINDFIAVDSYMCDYFRGTYDGDNHSITVLDTHIYPCYIDVCVGTCTIKNIEFLYGKFVRSLANVPAENCNLTVENITFDNTEEHNVATGVGYANYGLITPHLRGGTYTFKNIVNNANIDFGNAYAGVIVGGYYISGYATQNISYVNCTNNGIVSGVSVGFLTGNPSQNAQNFTLCNESDLTAGTSTTMVYVSGCANYGLLKGMHGAGAFAVTSTSSEHNQNAVNANETIYQNGFFKGQIVDGCETTVEIGLDNNKVVLSKGDSNADKYQVVVKTSVKYDNGSGWVEIHFNDLTADFKLNYISRMVNARKYEELTGISYNEIQSEELEGYAGIKYKLVDDGNGGYIAIINKSDMHDFDVIPTYMIVAYNASGTTISANQYKGLK